MSISPNQTLQIHEQLHERSRLDNIIPHNEDLINNLNLKIDRRINNGYYYQVAAKRKSLPLQNKYHFKAKAKPKKIHPIIKKPKKLNDQINVVDEQQNTDEVQFCQNWQNTSGIYMLKQPDPIVEDEQMQFSCEVTQIQQRNQSMQWSIQPIPHFNQAVQYTLESQIAFVECRDASIQYSIEDQPQPQPQPKPQPKPKIVYEDVQIQCQKIKKQEISLQYNEPLPETKEKDLQANLPDLQQLSKISSMENRMKYLNHEQRKQQKLQRQKDKQIQILKLKQMIEKLEGKINLAAQKEYYIKKRMDNELLLKEKERLFKQEKQKIRQQSQKLYNGKLETLLSKLKQTNKRPHISSSFWQEQQRRLAQIQRQQQFSKEQLQSYKKQVDDLKKNLKNQMLKRLNFENESEYDTATEQDEKQQSNSQAMNCFRRNDEFNMSMGNLFPSLQSKTRCAGFIVKNICQPEQRKLNQHQQAAKVSRAYWRSKSPFNYEYEQASSIRINRKYSYLQKVQQKKLSQIEILQAENPEQNYEFVPKCNKSKSRFNHIIESKINLKYAARKTTHSWQQLKQFKKKFDNLFNNEELFSYLYLQEDKIKLGLTLFDNLNVQIFQRVKNPIKIYKYTRYYVFQYQAEQNIYFILFFHNKSVIFSRISTQATNYEFYQSPNRYKNGEIFEYFNQDELFEGFYTNGQRDGYGILSNSFIYYEGDFSLSKKQGNGKLILQNGDIYKGQFKNNHFNGQGVYTWVNRQIYDGFFRQGLKNGWGKHYFKNGDIYEGQYQNNKRDGKGTYKWKEGSIFQGNFVNDEKCGDGKLLCANGSSVIGQWKNDELVCPDTKRVNKGISREELPLASKIKGLK